jgi:hypothetical protein
VQREAGDSLTAILRRRRGPLSTIHLVRLQTPRTFNVTRWPMISAMIGPISERIRGQCRSGGACLPHSRRLLEFSHRKATEISCRRPFRPESDSTPIKSTASAAQSAPGLGVPNVVDRLVQQAVLQVLEPIFEPTFHPSSHGFRPQAFLLVGTLVLLPVILTYSGWSYWVFRGKVRTDDTGYN